MRISDWSSDVCSSDLTDQSSTSSLAVPGSATDRYISTIGDKYWTFLPSANFILDLSEQDRLRMSFSRQMSRARFFDLRNSLAFGLADIRSEEHTSEHQSLMRKSYAVFCLQTQNN